MKTVKLSNSLEMPLLGYGVFQVNPDECERCVSDAIEVGYRLIDTAQIYKNEEGVGRAVANSGISRKDFFLVTKVWISNAGYEKAKQSIDKSLEKLKTDYIDLVLIHQPFGDYYGTYRLLEEYYEQGIIKSIGVSNFYADRFIDIASFVKHIPMVNQMETHVFLQQQKLHKILKENKCQLMSWGPFAEGKNNLFTNKTLLDIGKKYNKTSAQVALRYLLEQNIVVIPKTVNKDRMVENINVFDFELSDDDMAEILKLDTDTTLFGNHTDYDFVKYLLSIK